MEKGREMQKVAGTQPIVAVFEDGGRSLQPTATVASGSWEQPTADSQQGNRDTSSITASN